MKEKLSEDLEQSLALQMYYDDKKNLHPYKKTRNSVHSTFNNAKKDVEKKLTNAFRDCISVLEKNQLPSHHTIFTIKNLIENQKKIDSQTRIKLFLQSEALVEKFREYFTNYLNEWCSMKVVLSLEKYFILKSLKYLAEDISFSLMKGDETLKYKNYGILDFDDHLSNTSRKKIFVDGGRNNSREIIVIDEQNDEGLKFMVETLRTLVTKKFGISKSYKLTNKTLLEFYSFLSEFVNSCFGGNTKNIVEFSNSYIENYLKLSKSKRIMIGEIKIGVCRHRAILFKYLCDYLFVSGLISDIRCRLVRGNIKGENHAWNIVSVIDCETSNQTVQKFYLVDIMLHPGKLYSDSSIEAHTYMRQGVDGGVGGLSVRLSPNNDFYSVTGDKRLLGRGATGKVMSCCVNLPILGTIDCAIKKVILQNNQDRTVREIKLLTYLSHPNIITFYNARTLKSSTETSLFIYMELMDCNARKFISDFKNQITKETKEYVFELLFFLINVARGISYLHSKNIIHRDIKPENITLKYYRNSPKTIAKVKLVDFDIANSVGSGTICGTSGYIHYLDLLEPKTASTSLDCYSFGILLSEMFMDISPIEFFAKYPNEHVSFANYYSISNIEKQIDSKFNCIPSSYRVAFKEIISECIQAPEKRPKISQILVKLENYLLKNYVKKAEEVLATI